MKIDLLVITDGRSDYLWRMRQSLQKHVTGWCGEVLVDDSSHTLGFAGAIQCGWDLLLATSDADYVFHVEDDFVFTRDVDLTAMAEVMRDNPHLAQMALMRQPWSPEEKAAGGIVQMDPGAYSHVTTLPSMSGSLVWLEHRKNWTTNPSLYRRSLCKRGWPDAPGSEGKFGDHLFADPKVRCAYWGMGEVWVEHIGAQRAGTGY